MASKFSALPDIDTTSVDVYETSSSPELKPTTTSGKAKKSTRSGAGNDEDDDDDDSDVSEAEGAGSGASRSTTRRSKAQHAPLDNAEIDAQGMDTLEAMRRFEGSVGVGSRASASSYIETQSETPAARLRRLKREVGELEEDLRGGGSQEDTTTPSHITLVEQLRALRGDLSRVGGTEADNNSFDSEQRLAQAKRLLDTLQQPPRSSKADTNIATPTSTPAPAPAHILATYETRLSNLEHLLGGTLDTSTRPLLPTLTRLEQLATLLTQPRHIDAISKRVKVLVSELDRVHDSRRKLTANEQQDTSSDSQTRDPITSAKIQDLFALSTRLAPLVPLAPALLDRLRSLAALHSNASSFSLSMSTLEEQQAEMRTTLALFEQSLKQVEDSLQDNTRRFNENLQGVMARLDDLQKRVAAL